MNGTIILQSVEHLTDESGQVSDMELLDINEMSSRMHLEFVTGTMLRKRVTGFMRLLWCACRGNAFFKFVDLSEEVRILLL